LNNSKVCGFCELEPPEDDLAFEPQELLLHRHVPTENAVVFARKLSGDTAFDCVPPKSDFRFLGRDLKLRPAQSIDRIA
jgi:hypothetical protein